MKLLRVGLCCAGVALVAAPAAQACVRVGMYHDDPVKSFPAMQKKVGTGLKLVSVYLTANTGLDPKLIKLANQRKLTLVISWLPDGGKDSKTGKKYKLTAIAKGSFDASLKALGGQLRTLKKPPVVRLDARSEHALVRMVGHGQRQSPGRLCPRLEARAQGADEGRRKKVKLLWSVYARSVPDDKKNALRCTSRAPNRSISSAPTRTTSVTPRASPGPTPADLFLPAYGTIQKLAAKKPFWISETGSTARGGDTGAWIGALGQLARRPCQSSPESSGTTCATAPATSACRARDRPLPRSRPSSAVRASSGIRSHESLVERE